MITGSVVPIAINAGASSAQRIPGVESSAPPMPKAPDAMPEPNPMSAAMSVRKRLANQLAHKARGGAPRRFGERCDLSCM